MLCGFAPLALKAQTTPIPALNANAPLPAAEQTSVRVKVAAADDALQIGLSDAAAGLYSELAATDGINAELAARAKLGLASALLDRNDAAGALAALESLPDSPAKSLRVALAQIIADKTAAAKAAINKITPENFGALSARERAWYHVARGLVALSESNFALAKIAFEQAVAGLDPETETPLRRQIQTLYKLASIKEGKAPTEEFLAQLRQNAETYKNEQLGFSYAKELAIALNQAGRTADAVKELDMLLAASPRPLSPGEINEAVLLRGVIRGAGSDDGRRDFYEVIRNKADPALQECALKSLGSVVAQGAPNETAALAKEIFERLTILAAGTPDPSTLDLINLTRARVIFPLGTPEALSKAENAANDLLEKTPASPCRTDALRILASIAWQNKSYRRAADYLSQLKNFVPPARQPYIGLIAADCLFLAGDYPAAADAYAAVQALVQEPSQLRAALFNRVTCELAAGNIDGARRAVGEAQLTLAGRNQKAAADTFLRCDWAIIDRLRASGKNNDAATMLKTVFAENPEMPENFRIRFLWQQALLDFAAGKYADVIEISNQITERIGKTTAASSPELQSFKSKIISQAALLRARANYALDRRDDARADLGALREAFSGEEASAESFLLEGRELAAKNDRAAARDVFLRTYEKYRKNENPVLRGIAGGALFAAAQEAKNLAAGTNNVAEYESARALYAKFVAEFPENALVPEANLEQADLYRIGNDFDQAIPLYNDLIKSLPDSPIRRKAELRRADCLLAKAMKSTGRETAGAPDNAPTKVAVEAYERLFWLPGNSPDMIAEAGYKWANAVSLLKADPREAGRTETGIRDEARKDHTLVVSRLLRDKDMLASLGPNGRYWAVRSLFDIAKSYEQQGLCEDAREAYRFLIDCNRDTKNKAEHALPFEAEARRQLQILPRGTKSTGTAGN